MLLLSCCSSSIADTDVPYLPILTPAVGSQTNNSVNGQSVKQIQQKISQLEGKLPYLNNNQSMLPIPQNANQRNIKGEVNQNNSYQASVPITSNSSTLVNSPSPSSVQLAFSKYSDPKSGNDAGYQTNQYNILETETKKTNPFIIATLHQNHRLQIAVGELNTINLPFKKSSVETTSQAQLQNKNGNLFVATNDFEPISVVVTNESQPEQSITLTLKPVISQASTYVILLPEILKQQSLLNLPDLNSELYNREISRLMRFSAEHLLQKSYRVKKAKHSKYSVDNFQIKSNQINSQNLNLLQLSTKANPSYPELSCFPESLKVKRVTEYQPENFFFNEIKVKKIELQNESVDVLEFDYPSCLQANVIAASFFGNIQLTPLEKASLITFEIVTY